MRCYRAFVVDSGLNGRVKKKYWMNLGDDYIKLKRFTLDK